MRIKDSHALLHIHASPHSLLSSDFMDPAHFVMDQDFHVSLAAWEAAAHYQFSLSIIGSYLAMLRFLKEALSGQCLKLNPVHFTQNAKCPA